ncbi:MAG: enoyl-CoA hydratase/isomerase family protein [Nannocystaceae bacterium]|nr:enoyl-CoA hydratase/isomerase family protein [Myxococcales bacterium]
MVDGVTWTLEGGVYELTLARPPCNEIGTATLAGLEQFLDAIAVDDAHALIIRSAVRGGFCAGADLRELHAGLVATPEAEAAPQLAAFLDRIHAVMDRLDTLPLTTIAVIHGVCFGGGLELALTADVRIAEKTARFGFPELRLGVIPGFGGVPRMRRELGDALPRDLLLTGRTINAKRAHGVGLVSQCVPTGEGLVAARALAAQIGKFDPVARVAAKRFLKVIPVEELAREKRLFLELAVRPPLRAALDRFVRSQDVRPYLP